MREPQTRPFEAASTAPGETSYREAARGRRGTPAVLRRLPLNPPTRGRPVAFREVDVVDAPPQAFALDAADQDEPPMPRPAEDEDEEDGTPQARPRISEETRRRILALVAEGKSTAAVARETGVSTHSVRRLARV